MLDRHAHVFRDNMLTTVNGIAWAEIVIGSLGLLSLSEVFTFFIP